MTILTCLGDSITDCDHCFSRDSLGNGYVKMLSDRFERDDSDYQVRNYGTDGFTINRLLQRIQGDSDFTSDIITILIGINDIGLIMNTDRTPFQQRNMLVSFYKCYADLITILTKSNSRIILMEPFLFPWPACYRTWLPFRQKISQMIHQLSEQFQIPYLTLHEELNEKARQYGYSEITTDGIHLTEQGQKFLADRLYKLICGYSARCVKSNLSYNRLFSVALLDTIMYNDPKLIKEGFFMDKIIKEIEDMSLNAWPSHKMELYDGWILRFSYFYTHRTNSVEQFGTSTLSWREKVSFCEAEYARLGSPAIFKISPLVSPDFDYLLENRSYEIQHTTNVMAASLDGADLSAPCDLVTLTDDIPDIWIESLFDLKGTINPVHRAVVPSMYHAIVKDTVCASIWSNGKIIATGLGILDRNYIGLYAIHVREDFRHKGYARQICTALLKEGKKKGATKAYLQVVEGNTPARNLYESLGLHYLYTYWFRVQTHTN